MVKKLTGVNLAADRWEVMAALRQLLDDGEGSYGKSHRSATGRVRISGDDLRHLDIGGFRRAEQGDDEGGATAGGTLHGERALMPLDEGLRHRQPQPRAARALSSEEGIEQPLL